jgi:hypothetical protein
VTTVLEISLALSVVAGGIGRPLTRWISEHSRTRRQRDALDTLERLAATDAPAASLMPAVLRAIHSDPEPARARATDSVADLTGVGLPQSSPPHP